MAVPPIDVTAEPTDAGALRWIRLAAPASGGTEQGKLVVRLRLTNTSTTAAVTVTGITVSFPGSSVDEVEMFRPDIVLGDGGTIPKNDAKWWSTGVVNVKDANDNVIESAYNAIYLPIPAPSQVRFSIHAGRDVGHFTFALAEYQCPETDQGYPLFLRPSDMPSASMVTIGGRHWANGGGAGGQIYAYDVGVVRWVDGEWRRTRPGESGPSSYYAYGLPIRAIAAGTVHAIVDGIDEGPDFGDQSGGNTIQIAHTNGERSYFAHVQKHSFKVAQGDAVAAGAVLGLLGFTGNTDAPHCHIEIRTHSNGALRPYAFRDVWIRSRDADTPFDPDPKTNWVEIPVGRGIPDGSYHLWASPKRPAWFPPGWAEIFKFGMREGNYQEWFNRITYAGYRPEFVDVHEHGGDRFFNAIFRPADVAWRAEHHMDSGEYQAAFDTAKADGFHLHQITSYPRGGSVNYAAIWVKGASPALRAYHGRSRDEHQAQVERNEHDGYHPVNVSVAAPNGVPSYAALWAKSDVGGWRSRSTLTPSAYQTLWNEQAGDLNRHAAYLSAWQVMPNGPPMISTVFQQTAAGSGSTVGKHSMSGSELQAEFDTRIRAGWLTRAIAGYSEGGRATFAALWRKP